MDPVALVMGILMLHLNPIEALHVFCWGMCIYWDVCGHFSVVSHSIAFDKFICRPCLTLPELYL